LWPNVVSETNFEKKSWHQNLEVNCGTSAAGRPGVDVMITIFSDFCLFSVKKLAFFSKNNVMITIFPKTSSSLSKKRQFFRYILRRKYLKNHNIGP
jgi:hypothetical protein